MALSRRAHFVLLTSDVDTSYERDGDVLFRLREPVGHSQRSGRSAAGGAARVALANAVFPVSFNAVTSETNALRVVSASVDAVVLLDPLVHYDPATLAATLESLLQAAGFDLDVAFSAGALRLVVNAREACEVRAEGTTAAELLGLPRGGEDLALPVGTTLFPRPVDLGGPRYLVVSTNLSSQNNDASTIGGTLASVPVDASPGQMLVYQPSQLAWSHTVFEQLMQLRVRVSDEHGRIIDFENIPWSIQLVFEFGNDAT